MNNSNSIGVNNVVGSMLMIFVVVVLLALVTVVLFDIANKQRDSADVSVQISHTSTGIETKILRNENANEIFVLTPLGEFSIGSEPGTYTQVESGNGTYQVIAELEGSGVKQVVDKEVVDTIDTDGYFYVKQYPDRKEAYGVLKRPFDGVENHQIVVNADQQRKSDTLSSVDDGSDDMLLDSLIDNDPKTLPQQAVEQRQKIDVSANSDLFGIGKIKENPKPTQFSVGQEVAIHRLVNLCKGDEIYLLDADTPKDNRTVLATGDEIKFDSVCDNLRMVSETRGNELLGLKLYNIGGEPLDSGILNWNGYIPPIDAPIEPPNTDIDYKANKSFDVTVNSCSGGALSGAKVHLNNERTKTTDSSGTVSFDNLKPTGNTLFITASKKGYRTDQIPVEIPSKPTGSINDKTMCLKTNSNADNTVKSVTKSVSSGGSASVDLGSGVTSLQASIGSGWGGGGSGWGWGGSGGGGGWGGGGSYSTSSPSPSTRGELEPQDAGSEIIQPNREFELVNAADLTQTRGPSGKFGVQAVVEMNPESDAYRDTDTVTITAKKVDGGTQATLHGPTSISTDLNQDKPGRTNHRPLYFDENTPTGTYAIFGTLQSSGMKKQAGTIKVVKQSAANVTITNMQISPENPTLDSSGEVELTISADVSGLESGKSTELELWRNTRDTEPTPVDEKTYNSGDGSISFTRVESEPGVHSYNIVARGTSSGPGERVMIGSRSSTNFDASIETSVSISGNSTSCSSITPNGNQFDCEIKKGESIDISGSVTVTGSEAENYTNDAITVTWGDIDAGKQKTIYDGSNVDIDWSKSLSSTYNPDNFASEITGFGSDSVQFKLNNITYDQSEAYVIVSEITGEDNSGNDVGGDITQSTLNVAYENDEITSSIQNIEQTGSDQIEIKLQSERPTGNEYVNLHFLDGSGNYVSTNSDVIVTRKYLDPQPVYKTLDLSQFGDKGDESATVQVAVTDNTTSSVSSMSSDKIIDSSTISLNTGDTLKDTKDKTRIGDILTSNNQITVDVANTNDLYDESPTVQYVNKNTGSVVNTNSITVGAGSTKTVTDSLATEKYASSLLRHGDTVDIDVKLDHSKTNIKTATLTNSSRPYLKSVGETSDNKLKISVKNPNGAYDQSINVNVNGASDFSKTVSAGSTETYTKGVTISGGGETYDVSLQNGGKGRELSEYIRKPRSCAETSSGGVEILMDDGSTEYVTCDGDWTEFDPDAASDTGTVSFSGDTIDELNGDAWQYDDNQYGGLYGHIIGFMDGGGDGQVKVTIDPAVDIEAVRANIDFRANSPVGTSETSELGGAENPDGDYQSGCYGDISIGGTSFVSERSGITSTSDHYEWNSNTIYVGSQDTYTFKMNEQCGQNEGWVWYDGTIAFKQ